MKKNILFTFLLFISSFSSADYFGARQNVEKMGDVVFNPIISPTDDKFIFDIEKNAVKKVLVIERCLYSPEYNHGNQKFNQSSPNEKELVVFYKRLALMKSIEHFGAFIGSDVVSGFVKDISVQDKAMINKYKNDNDVAPYIQPNNQFLLNHQWCGELRRHHRYNIDIGLIKQFKQEADDLEKNILRQQVQQKIQQREQARKKQEYEQAMRNFYANATPQQIIEFERLQQQRQMQQQQYAQQVWQQEQQKEQQRKKEYAAYEQRQHEKEMQERRMKHEKELQNQRLLYQNNERKTTTECHKSGLFEDGEITCNTTYQ